MRISTKGRYSLEALLYIVLRTGEENAGGGGYVSTRSIAGNTGISVGYLEQLFIPLRRAGIVKGTRGPQGGYLPAKPPAEISVGDVLRAVEGPLEPVACAAADSLCARETECVSRRAWKELYRAVAECVDSVSLAGLAEGCAKLDAADYAI